MRLCLSLVACVVFASVALLATGADDPPFRLRVLSVDKEKQTVSAAAGEEKGQQVVQLRVTDPAILGRLKVGDEVVVNLADQTITIVVKMPLEVAGADGKEADALSRARDQANELRCRVNLRQVGLGLTMYAAENKGRFPPNLGKLVGRHIDNPAVLLCPTAAKAVPAEFEKLKPDEKEKWIVENTSYGYNGAGKKQTAPADTVLVFEMAGSHALPLVSAVFADNHLEVLTPEQWKKLLEQDAGLKAVFEAMRPAKADPAKAGAKLQFRLMVPPGEEPGTADVFPDPLDLPGGKIHVRREVIASESDVASAQLSPTDPDGRRELLLEFTEEAARRMHEVTTAHLGGSLAIVFDGKLVTRVAIQTPVGKHAAIAAGADPGLFDPDAILRAVRDAKAGAAAADPQK